MDGVDDEGYESPIRYEEPSGEIEAVTDGVDGMDGRSQEWEDIRV